jgi:signal transduction histidine kinase
MDVADSASDLYYDFLFRSTADGVLIANADLHIQQINPAAAALLATTIEQVRNKGVHQCFGKYPALVNLFTRQGDQTLDVHLPQRRLAVGIATTLENGSRMIILQDVTEQRDLESRREALISRVSHDLRNPISALDGFAELVTKFGELNPHQTRFLGRIRQTSSKIYDVIGSLVDLAWIEAGMPQKHTPIQLHEIIRQVINKLSDLAASRQMRIAISVQSPLPPIMGDADRLATAIYNVLHNAIIYSRPEHTVAIHAWGDTHEAYCSIADQGIGIADDEIPLIFDRLYRSRDEQVTSISGGGLGLTLAKTIITRHGGAIWATSNLGQGSVFTFVLPAIDA